MVAPILPPAIFFLIFLGESVLLFAIPLLAFIYITVKLAEKLNIKDAISYPFVQYPFLFLLIFLLQIYSSPGLAFILILPMTFVINMIIGYLYFRFAKNKKWFTKVLIFLFTLLVTLALYSKEGQPSILSILFSKL